MEIAEAGAVVAFFGYIAFLGKPIWYSLILAFASKRLVPFDPHGPPPHAESKSPAAMKTRERFRFAAGGVARMVLGWTFLIIMGMLGETPGPAGSRDLWRPSHWNDAIFIWLGAYGFILWYLIGKAVFPRAPSGRVVAFAAIAEIASLLVDIPVVLATRFNMC